VRAPTVSEGASHGYCYVLGNTQPEGVTHTTHLGISHPTNSPPFVNPTIINSLLDVEPISCTSSAIIPQWYPWYWLLFLLCMVRSIAKSLMYLANAREGVWEYRGSNRCVSYGSLCTTYFMYTLDKVESNHVMLQSVCLD
jgi:hypothetical protein